MVTLYFRSCVEELSPPLQPIVNFCHDAFAGIIPELVLEPIPELVPEPNPELNPESIPELVTEPNPELNPESIPDLTPESISGSESAPKSESFPELELTWYSKFTPVT